MAATKPSTPEEEYFARVESEKLKKLAAKKQAELSEAEKEKLKELHWMRCPKCGMELHELPFRGVTIDKCYSCNGMFLDDGEIEALTTHEEAGFFKALGSLFKD